MSIFVYCNYGFNSLQVESKGVALDDEDEMFKEVSIPYRQSQKAYGLGQDTDSFVSFNSLQVESKGSLSLSDRHGGFSFNSLQVESKGILDNLK